MVLTDLKEPKLRKDALLMTGASFVLSRIMVGNFLFTIPLMVLHTRFTNKREALAPVGVLALLILATELYKARGALGSVEGKLLFLISLFIPTVLLVASAVWIALEGHPTSHRYLASSLFGVVASVVMVIWFSHPSPALLRVDELFYETFANLFGQGSTSGFSEAAMKNLYRVAVMSTGAMLAPMCMVLVGFSSFMALSWTKREAGDFATTVSRWKVSEQLLWPFLGAWTVVLLLMVIKASYLPRALSLQVALSLSVLYAVQGVAIIVHFLLKRGRVVRISRLVTYLFLLAFVVPGLNVLVIFALPLLGVTESWFTYRRYE
ncbi:MAG TPA: DUF115 domain-containing protein [Sphaerochaeta sp.]|jgi:hypothetical protein|nr:DUF115 domain-containing protein [Sphaerochaeta sp.]